MAFLLLLPVLFVQPVTYSYTAASYTDLMSQAVSEYANHNPAKAEKYLMQALQLKPDDKQARQMLNELRTEKLHRLLDEAEILHEEERWQDAVETYQQAKALNIPSEKLTQGLEIALLYIEAERRLSKYTKDIRLLLEPAMRKNAVQTIKQIKSFDLVSKKISSAMQMLQSMLGKLDKPYSVHIHSDDKSEIIIYKIGSLGSFQEKQLMLKPGKYIAVARCLGYREVRHEFEVIPDKANGFQIRCEERIE